MQQQNTWIHASAAVCLLVLAGAELCGGQEQPQVDRSLKILYAGHPNSDREKDFVGFLKTYFDVVRTGNLETLQEADTRGFDVTLLDWDLKALEGPCPSFSESFSRPVITLGVHGSMICSRWQLKTTYL